ncbi:MAG TPA: hypothetical protein VHP14_03440, partial [Anaerolineales bacterium]|nr:hypothetical protein [Anaerolineales bacterium]
MQDHFGLLGLLHGKLTGAAHQRLQTVPCLDCAAVFTGVFEEDLCQPALYFDLGLLRSGGDRTESAIRHLQHSMKHKDFG